VFVNVYAYKQINIYNWYFDKKNFLDSQDHFINRLICPNIIQYNINKGKFDFIILKSVNEYRLGDQWIWNLNLRTGIYKWNQKELNSADFKLFFNQQIKKIIYKKSLNLWKIPKYKFVIEGKYNLKIIWEQKPVFGVYIFNFIPFKIFSKDKNICAGIYIPILEKEKLILKPSYKYSDKRPELIFHNTKIHKKEYFIEFNVNFFKNCNTIIDSKYITVIIWQDSFKNMDIKNFVQNKLFYGFFDKMKWHTGISTNIPNFLIKQSNSYLKPRAYRKIKTNFNTIELNMHISNKLDLIISDYLSLNNVKINNKNNLKLTDFTIKTIEISWPNLDFIQDFHSKAVKKIVNISDKKLDKMAQYHALSLTDGKQNHFLVSKINKYINSIKPFSILAYHKTCVKSNIKNLEKVFKSYDINNYNWFKYLISYLS
jgi:hypothetical protein